MLSTSREPAATRSAAANNSCGCCQRFALVRNVLNTGVVGGLHILGAPLPLSRRPLGQPDGSRVHAKLKLQHSHPLLSDHRFRPVAVTPFLSAWRRNAWALQGSLVAARARPRSAALIRWMRNCPTPGDRSTIPTLNWKRGSIPTGTLCVSPVHGLIHSRVWFQSSGGASDCSHPHSFRSPSDSWISVQRLCHPPG